MRAPVSLGISRAENAKDAKKKCLSSPFELLERLEIFERALGFLPPALAEKNFFRLFAHAAGAGVDGFRNRIGPLYRVALFNGFEPSLQVGKVI